MILKIRKNIVGRCVGARKTIFGLELKLQKKYRYENAKIFRKFSAFGNFRREDFHLEVV